MRSTARCGGSPRTTWMSTRSTIPTRRRRSRRACARWTTSCAPERRATWAARTTSHTRFTHPTAGARYRERYWHERELATVEALRPLAAEAGMSMAQMAIAWVLENPVVTAPIVGASRPEQLDDALAAVEKGLDASLTTRLDDLTREYRWGDDIR